MKKKSKIIPIVVHAFIFIVAGYFFIMGVLNFFGDDRQPARILLFIGIILFVANILAIIVHVIIKNFIKTKPAKKGDANLDSLKD